MMMTRTVFGYLFVLYTIAHIGNLCYRYSIKNLTSRLRLGDSVGENRQTTSQHFLRSSGGAHDNAHHNHHYHTGTQNGNYSSRFKPHYIPWTNETKYEIIERALEKYVAHGKDEIDLPNGIGLRGVLRLIDPIGGRDSTCLHRYFRNWTDITEDIPRDPLFESFFEWLDYGEGKDIQVHKHCPHIEMDQSRHYKFTATQRGLTEMDIAVDKKTGRIVNVTFAFMPETVPDGMWLFVWGIDRKIYILDETERDDRHFGHASFFAGRPVLLAGEMNITKNHTVEWINNSSGHYRPTLKHLANFYKYLRDVKGVNVTTIEWRQDHDDDNISALNPDWVDNLEQNYPSKYSFDHSSSSRSRSYSPKIKRLSKDLRPSPERSSSDYDGYPFEVDDYDREDSYFDRDFKSSKPNVTSFVY